MKNLLTFILLVISCSVFAQKNKLNCRNYTVEIIDNKSYWDTILPGLKKKAISVPVSNLTETDEILPTNLLAKIKQEIYCDLIILNERRQNSNEPIDTSFSVISNKSYKSHSGIKLYYILAETKTLKMQIGVIGILTKGGLLTYSDINELELKINLRNIEKINSGYLVYGEQKGNPDNPYGGNFKLTFKGNKRTIAYQYYEKNN